uniref:60S ribosomal protein L27a n=1 Tax=Romanomermis culicivorax TaxID=13658 RepID=A0A915K8J9_ROMCU
MRNFHVRKNQYYCPTVNVEKLWSLVSEQCRETYAKTTEKAPVIDCVKAGYFKVLGKGRLPSQPCIVKAKFFSKSAESKIKKVGGACVLNDFSILLFRGSQIMNNLLSKIKTKRFRRRNASSSVGDDQIDDDEEEKTLTDDLHQKSPSFTRLKLQFFDGDDDEKSLAVAVEQQKPSCSIKTDEDLGGCSGGELYMKPRLQRDLKNTLSDPTSLGYFLTYMENRGLRHLVKFWLDAETFRLAGKSMLERLEKKINDLVDGPENCHVISLIEQDAVSIFAKYLSKESSYDIGLTEQLRNEIINKICCENGRLDLDCFITAQDFILNIMQLRYYPDYLRSVLYCKHVLEVLDQRKNLTITDILYDETCLFHFVEFLEQENKLDLIEFWLAAKNFREKIDKNRQNDELSGQGDAMILYNKYFSLQSNRRLEIFDHRMRTKLEDEICKPTVYRDIFEPACQMALKLLEKEYLPKFLKSKLFVKLYDEIVQASRDDLELPNAYSSRKKTKKSTKKAEIGNLTEKSFFGSKNSVPNSAQKILLFDTHIGVVLEPKFRATSGVGSGTSPEIFKFSSVYFLGGSIGCSSDSSLKIGDWSSSSLENRPKFYANCEKSSQSSSSVSTARLSIDDPDSLPVHDILEILDPDPNPIGPGQNILKILDPNPDPSLEPDILKMLDPDPDRIFLKIVDPGPISLARIRI